MDIFDVFREFALHDTKLHSIEIIENGVIFLFQDGIYKTDQTGKELFLTPKCTMCISICNFDKERSWEHVFVQQIKKHRIAEKSLLRLIDLLNNDPLNISMQYQSYFGNSILINGWNNKGIFVLEISEIDKIICSFL